MPELPEVETICACLKDVLIGKKITSVEIRFDKAVQKMTPEEFRSRLGRAVISGVARRGKFILLHLSSGDTLIIHLRMTGRLIYQLASPSKHTRAVFGFSDGSVLDFSDQRKFGTLSLERTSALPCCPQLAALGPEPLEKEFSAEYLQEILSRSKRPIKNFILDQSRIAGIGNIYACEALFRACIHPEKPASDLARDEIKSLHRQIRAVLRDGIRHSGTSISNFADAFGNPGGFQRLLRVYKKEGSPCPRCGSPVERIRQSGRSTFFCRNCQK
jgi:formamidopyrimidine-DNA glycosylase